MITGQDENGKTIFSSTAPMNQFTNGSILIRTNSTIGEISMDCIYIDNNTIGIKEMDSQKIQCRIWIR
jgi:hypothetical protein